MKILVEESRYSKMFEDEEWWKNFEEHIKSATAYSIGVSKMAYSQQENFSVYNFVPKKSTFKASEYELGKIKQRSVMKSYRNEQGEPQMAFEIGRDYYWVSPRKLHFHRYLSISNHLAAAQTVMEHPGMITKKHKTQYQELYELREEFIVDSDMHKIVISKRCS